MPTGPDFLVNESMSKTTQDNPVIQESNKLPPGPEDFMSFLPLYQEWWILCVVA